MALCALTFAEFLRGIIAAALSCLSAWVFIAFMLYCICKCFLCSLR